MERKMGKPYSPEPVVSVIIPIYNGQIFLRQCLDSIVKQNLVDFEVICVDDGSEDNSRCIINEYCQKDKRIHLIARDKNIGQWFARNEGILSACGEYIAFIDADDFLETKYLSHLLKQTISTGVELCLCSGDEYWVDEEEYKKAEWIFNPRSIPHKKTFTAREFPRTIFQICGEQPWCKLIKRDLLVREHIHFDDLIVFEDFPFSCRCLSSARSISYIDEVLYHYRKYPAQISSAVWNKLVNFDGLINAKNYLVASGFYEEIKHSFLDKCMFAIQWRIKFAANDTTRRLTKALLINKVLPELEIHKEYSNLIKSSQDLYDSLTRTTNG